MNTTIYVFAAIGALLVLGILFLYLRNKYLDYMAKKPKEVEQPEEGSATQGNENPPPTTYPDGTPIKPKP